MRRLIKKVSKVVKVAIAKRVGYAVVNSEYSASAHFCLTYSEALDWVACYPYAIILDMTVKKGNPIVGIKFAATN